MSPVAASAAPTHRQGLLHALAILLAYGLVRAWHARQSR
jgi:hypothetical protein